MIAALADLHWMRPVWLLALLPAALLFTWHWRRAGRSSGWETLVDPQLLEHLLDAPAHSGASHRRRLPLLAAACATLLAIVAMAGPAFEKTPQPPQQTEDTMVIIADLTLSMYAEDIAPSRLTRMRYKLLELLARRREGLTALLAYSGDAHIVSPLTDDAGTISAMVPALSPEIMPKLGSNAASAFALAQAMLPASTHSRVVWFTDDTSDADNRALRELIGTSRAQLLIVGIGTVAGGPIPLPSGKFLKDAEGAIASAPLPISTLQDVARQNGGSFMSMRADNSDIDWISEHRFTSTAASRTGSEALLFDSWRDRGGTLCLALLPFALLAFRRGWILGLQALVILPLLFLHMPPKATAAGQEPIAPDAGSLWLRSDQQAARLLERGAADRAAALFATRPDWRGVAAYSAGDYATAAEAFKQQLAKHGDQQYPQAADDHYNLGHAQARSGALKEALQSYTKALALRPDFDNAMRAKALVEQLLQQQAQQDGQGAGQDQQDGQQQDAGQQTSSQSGSAQNESGQQASQNNQSGNEGDSTSSQQANAANAAQGNSTDESQAPQRSAAEDSQRAARDGDYSGDIDGQDEQQARQANASNMAQVAGEQESEAGQQNESSQLNRAQRQGDDSTGEPGDTALAQMQDGGSREEALQQAQLQQWLNKIEDDPGGLLRRKFQYQRQLRERAGDVVETSEDGKIW